MIQFIYASAATVEFTKDDLKKLLAKARSNNHSLEVSGMLVYHEGSFLQILEGEEDVVNALYSKIEKDSRHDNVRLLLRSEIEERSFGEWKMGFYDATASMLFNKGFFDFFRKGDVFDDASADRAHAVLMQFRDGAWRQHVEVDD